MKRTRKHILIPSLLAIYLAFMAYMGLDGLRSGQIPPLQYFATIAITLGIIILLYFILKKRERLRNERLEDIARREEEKRENNI